MHVGRRLLPLVDMPKDAVAVLTVACGFGIAIAATARNIILYNTLHYAIIVIEIIGCPIIVLCMYVCTKCKVSSHPLLGAIPAHVSCPTTIYQ